MCECTRVLSSYALATACPVLTYTTLATRIPAPMDLLESQVPPYAPATPNSGTDLRICYPCLVLTMGICYSSPVLSLRICDQPRRNRGCQRSKRRVGGDARGRRTATGTLSAHVSAMLFKLSARHLLYLPTRLLGHAYVHATPCPLSAMPCPVLTSAICLRPCYAVPGTITKSRDLAVPGSTSMGLW